MEKAFQDYASNLIHSIDEYLKELDELKVKDTSKWFRVLKTALRSGRKHQHRQTTSSAINDMGHQFTTHINAIHIPKISLQLEDQKQQTEEMEDKILNGMRNLSDHVQRSHENHAGYELSKTVQQWFEDQEALKVRRRCFETLYFKELYHREDRVALAHGKMYEWICETGDGEDPRRCKFSKWLRADGTDRNVFWISGKPGAGKTTLMKFMAHHRLLKASLKDWAGEETLLVIEYYFWRSGSPIQRSLTGMLRSVLYQILKKVPGLIDVAFPDREWMSGGPTFQFPLKSILVALHTVLNPVTKLNMRLFILIDGLDEFDNRDEMGTSVVNELKLIEFLGIFARSPSAKLWRV